MNKTKTNLVSLRDDIEKTSDLHISVRCDDRLKRIISLTYNNKKETLVSHKIDTSSIDYSYYISINSSFIDYLFDIFFSTNDKYRPSTRRTHKVFLNSLLQVFNNYLNAYNSKENVLLIKKYLLKSKDKRFYLDYDKKKKGNEYVDIVTLDLKDFSINIVNSNEMNSAWMVINNRDDTKSKFLYLPKIFAEYVLDRNHKIKDTDYHRVIYDIKSFIKLIDNFLSNPY